MTPDKIIRVGTGVIVLNDRNQILAGKRKSPHGQGTWGLVGGHVDFGETLEECAAREALEETGLVIGDVKIITTCTNFFDNKTKHYVTVFLAGRVTGGALEMKEPDKFETWQFFDSWAEIPQPHFLPYAEIIDVTDLEKYKFKSNSKVVGFTQSSKNKHDGR